MSMSYEYDQDEDEDNYDDQTDPDVKREFFKDHFDFLDRLEGKKTIKVNKFRNRRNRVTKIRINKPIFMVEIDNMTFYFNTKRDAYEYIEINTHHLFDKLYEKYKGLKNVFVTRKMDTDKDVINNLVYTRCNNSFLSYDNLEHSLSCTKLNRF